MCTRFAPSALPTPQWGPTRSWRLALVFGGLLGCSSAAESGSSSPTDTVSSVDSDVASDSDISAGNTDAADGSDVVETPVVSGDPIVPTSYRALGAATTVGALAASGGTVYAFDGADIVELGNCERGNCELGSGEPGDATPTKRFSLDAPGVALARTESATFAVDADGTWYRFEGAAVVKQPGPVVQRLRIGGDRVVGLLGRGGLVVADTALSAPPTVMATVPVARDVQFGDGYWLIATEDGGCAAIAPDGTIRATFATEGPVTALAALGPNRFVAVEASVALNVIDVTVSGNDLSIDYVGGAAYTGLGLSVAAAADGRHVLVADWHGVTAFDMADPTAPTQVATESLTGRGLDVVAAGGDDYIVRGLDRAARMTVHTGVVSPELSLSPEQIQIESSAEFKGGSSGLLVKNAGKQALHLKNVAAGDPRVTLSLPAPDDTTSDGVDVIVPPGDVAFLELAVTEVVPFETTLTFNTDDPSRPAVTVPVSVNPTRLTTGDIAPDFTLPSTAGAVITLARHRGEVVFVKLFNRY